jgi:hypothetical protein
VFRKKRRDKHIQMSIKLIISHREAFPIFGLRKRLHRQITESTWSTKICPWVYLHSSITPGLPRRSSTLSPWWFGQRKCCELLFEIRTRCNESSARASHHSRFLPLMAIFGLKKCAPPVRTSHKWRTSICDSLFSQARPVSRNMHNTCEKNTCDL